MSNTKRSLNFVVRAGIFVCGCALAAALFAEAAFAQESAPLGSSALDRTLDAIGSTDPITLQPRSIGDDLPVKRGVKPAAKKEKGPTEITAMALDFDQKAHQAIFTRDVVVDDPEFHLTCDKLTAYLKHDDQKAADEKPAAKPADPPPGNPPPKGEKQERSGGLDHAVAEGSVVITQEKLETNGSTTRNVGRGRQATYDSNTGNIVLTGMPQVQQGINTCVALDDGTVMTLNREGKMKVTGAHKMVIKDSGSDNSR
jgi:lipopolysaccharide export system protein LptA